MQWAGLGLQMLLWGRDELEKSLRRHFLQVPLGKERRVRMSETSLHLCRHTVQVY